MNPQDQLAERARRRLRGLIYHLIGYVVVMMMIVPANLILNPRSPLFALPMVGWGSILALHTAWAMGLFDIVSRND